MKNYVTVEIPVRVRRFEIDTEKLKILLRSHKCLTNRDIAEGLGVPVTKVEHWFRKDDCFAIPDADIWYKLKGLLGIQTDEFDEPISAWIERPGVFEKSGRLYLTRGVAPSILTGSEPKIILGEYTRMDEYIYRIRKLTPRECWRLMGFGTHNADGSWNDEAFNKAEAVNSNTQLYKQAGNSIVVDVLEKIFGNLLIGVQPENICPVCGMKLGNHSWERCPICGSKV